MRCRCDICKCGFNPLYEGREYYVEGKLVRSECNACYLKGLAEVPSKSLFSGPTVPEIKAMFRRPFDAMERIVTQTPIRGTVNDTLQGSRTCYAGRMGSHSPAKRSLPPVGLPQWHEARWVLQKLCNDLTDLYGAAMESAAQAAVMAGFDVKDLHWRYESQYTGARAVNLYHGETWLAQIALSWDAEKASVAVVTHLNEHRIGCRVESE